MISTEKLKPAKLTPLAIAAAPLAALTSNPFGRVVEHFHIGYAVAGAAVTAIVSGGWEVAILFPWIIPVEATVTGLVAVMGTAAAIAW